MEDKKEHISQHEAEIKEEPFVLVYLNERCDFGNNFKTQEEAIEEAKKDVKVLGDKVLVCRRIAKLTDGQFGEEVKPLVQFERQIVPEEKKKKPVKRVKVKVERAEMERLIKEREKEWKKGQEDRRKEAKKAAEQIRNKHQE